VVFDSTLRIPLEARVIRTARETPTVVIGRDDDPARRRAIEAQGATVLLASDPRAALRDLRRMEIRSLLLEGGPRLAGAFLAAGIVDRIALFTAPHALGEGAPRAFEHAPTGFEAALASYPVIAKRAFDEDSLMIRAVHSIPKARQR
jgi:diaminohydroxyphosphoribosylaminopyrimidine deaminase / 5-amino-6-(5-phosphoribosylamino)uracil reductase